MERHSEHYLIVKSERSKSVQSIYCIMTKTNKIIVLGSRGSRLAIAQTKEVRTLIAQKFPDIEIRHKVIATAGDQDQMSDAASIGVGIFVKEIENELMRGNIDVAVHSLKDLPSQTPQGLTIASVPYREDPRDVVISRNGLSLEQLQRASIIATGSARRRALIHSMRHDFILRPIRGNVTTRLEMLDREDSDIDALILAAAGIKRLGIENRITQYLGCKSFIPAPGQGALALESRSDDDETIAILQAVQHEDTRKCVEAERVLLSEIGGGCTASLGAHAQIRQGAMHMATFVANPSGTKVLKCSQTATMNEGIAVAKSIAKQLIARGAKELMPNLVATDHAAP